MLQIVAAIHRREFWESRKAKSLASWSTRVLATMIAGGYMTDGKTENKALTSAMKLSIDDIEAAELEDLALHSAETPATPEAAPGSFERILSAFGGTPPPLRDPDAVDDGSWGTG